MQFGQIERSFFEDDLWSLCSLRSSLIDSNSLMVEDEPAKTTRAVAQGVLAARAATNPTLRSRLNPTRS